MLQKKFEKIEDDVTKNDNKSEKQAIKDYKEALKELKVIIALAYEKYAIDGKLTFFEMSKFDRIKKLDKDIAEKITLLYAKNKSNLNATLRFSYVTTFTDTKNLMEVATKKTLRSVLKEVNVTKTINEDMAGLNWGERIAKDRADLIYSTQKTVKEGLSNGETYQKMAQRMSKQLGSDVPNYNRIVRTESARVHRTAQLEVLNQAKAQGVKMTKTWNTVGDTRVRGNKPTDQSNHVKMNGVTIPYDDLFTLPDGIKTFGPGLTGVAKHDINERCFLTFEIV